MTLPIIMLSWIPFRAESVEITGKMWLKVINPYAYTYLGMRENVYIITFSILIFIFMAYLTQVKLVPKLITGSRGSRLILILGEILVFSIMIPLVIIFLRPISQFIYFQF